MTREKVHEDQITLIRIRIIANDLPDLPVATHMLGQQSTVKIKCGFGFLLDVWIVQSEARCE